LELIELIFRIVAAFGASWLATAIWVAAGFLILAILRLFAGWYLDFEDWIKGLFKGGD
jgi:hypothetical protein